MLIEALVTFPNLHNPSVVRIPPNAGTREAYRVYLLKHLKNNLSPYCCCYPSVRMSQNGNINILAVISTVASLRGAAFLLALT